MARRRTVFFPSRGCYHFLMKKIIIPAILLLVSVSLLAAPQADEAIYLIIRADDIGSSHAANLACIKSFREGIARSVEVMTPCSWFPEAVTMLRENPGYDVGVHLTLTSEWDNVKWGPLTDAPTLVDGNGYFFPKTRTPEGSTERSGFWDESVSLEEVEAEVRAQIELAVNNIPQVSHVSDHMGWSRVDPRIAEIVKRVAGEYGLDIDLAGLGVKGARWGSSNSDDTATRIEKLVAMLKGLEPGLYMLIEHPGMNTPEMEGHGHEGYRNVHTHRDAVTMAFCSPEVKKAVADMGIKLVSYKEAWELFGDK